MKISDLEPLFLRVPRGAMSRVRLLLYRLFGLTAGSGNRLEAIRCRRLAQIKMGHLNAFMEGCWLWPEDTPAENPRIVIGDKNYFNRGVMIDACNRVEIGNDNMFGPHVYITDSNHQVAIGKPPGQNPMIKGHVTIGNGCWIGAYATILRNVELGDYCIVGAGSVVTKSFPPGSVVTGVPAVLICK